MLTIMPISSRPDLAAHPDVELQRGRQDQDRDDVGEENQDPGVEVGA